MRRPTACGSAITTAGPNAAWSRSPGHRLRREFLAPEVFFELDTCWAKTAGLDPAEVLRKLGVRTLVHIKDGPAIKTQP